MARTKMFPSIVQRNRSLVKTKSTKKKQENPWRFDARRLGAGQWHPGALLEHPSPNPPARRPGLKCSPPYPRELHVLRKGPRSPKAGERVNAETENADLHRYINLGAYFDEPLHPRGDVMKTRCWTMAS
ncbi:hypothetical protein DPEC_G00109040 [Dallia pectoralis]|uniref:Uncharacterized protein n=1 Tax=Dallia pectoralis TaxID=75939 RepID=A0ACC2GSH0_DALPE|nr:hypothetical protein DPEC_G00109040 [Dallia pectoralis]